MQFIYSYPPEAAAYREELLRLAAALLRDAEAECRELRARSSRLHPQEIEALVRRYREATTPIWSELSWLQNFAAVTIISDVGDYL